jgi:hypothetical protein
MPISLNKANKLLLILIILLSLAGCANTPLKICHTKCEQYNKLSQVVACVKQNLKNNPYYKTHPKDKIVTKSYINYADTLIEDVKNNKITESEAKAKLSSMYKQLRLEKNTKPSLYDYHHNPQEKLNSSYLPFDDPDDLEKPGAK